VLEDKSKVSDESITVLGIVEDPRSETRDELLLELSHAYNYPKQVDENYS
jgi:hypothetical protein